jgi:hypothetical protein
VVGTRVWKRLGRSCRGALRRLVEPDHLRRCLDILEGLPRLDDGEAIGSWLSGREAESEAMPDRARQHLFDEWFGGAYDEPRRKEDA